MGRYIFIVVILFFSCCMCEETKKLSINDFKRSYFKIINQESNFYSVQSGIEAETSKDILTTGYLNNDLNVDIVLTDLDNKKLEFYVYSDLEDGKFENWGSYTLENPKQGERIVGSHFVELKTKSSGMVIISKYEDENTQIHFKLKGFEMIYGEKDTQGKTPISLKAIDNFEYDYETGVDKPAEPLNFQLFNKSKEANQSNYVVNYWLIVQKSQRKIISFDENTQSMIVRDFLDLFKVDKKVKHGESIDVKKQDNTWYKGSYLMQGGAFAFVDMNFDCRADLMFETIDKTDFKRYMEFYFFQGHDKPFQFISRIEISPELGLGKLVDLGTRNILDLIFYNSREKSIDIFLGSVPNTKISDQNISKFCSKDNTTNLQFGFPYINDIFSVQDNKGYAYQIPLKMDLYTNSSLNIVDNIRFADLDMDGYPDLIMVTPNKNEDDTTQKLVVMKNIKCTKEESDIIFPGEDFAKLCRIFSSTPFEHYNEKLAETNCQRFGFFDLGERGYIGFFTLNYKQNENNDIIGTEIKALLNFIDWENYNLKGAAKFSKTSVTTLKGIKMLIKKTTNTAEYEILSSSQSLNQPNREFNLPFVIFGLGQITNYLEDFTLGYGVLDTPEPHIQDFTPIIPNSRLIVYTPNFDHASWELEIQLNPNK